jgi:hypothetical protein
MIMNGGQTAGEFKGQILILSMTLKFNFSSYLLLLICSWTSVRANFIQQNAVYLVGHINNCFSTGVTGNNAARK